MWTRTNPAPIEDRAEARKVFNRRTQEERAENSKIYRSRWARERLNIISRDDESIDAEYNDGNNEWQA